MPADSAKISGLSESEASTSLVSVVIPSRNRCDKLLLCLESLIRQDYPRIEMIVIDDASADATAERLKVFIQNHVHRPVKFLRNDSPRGANPSRNRGVAAAEGELIAFLDDDCTAEPDWISRLTGVFGAPDVAAATGLVVDHPPRNLYELTFLGTHRIHRAGEAHRLIAGNMCIRAGLLRRFQLDEDRAAQDEQATGNAPPAVSGRGDEEGLFLLLKAAGFAVRAVPDAVVHHDHPCTAGSFFRQAWRGGRSAARLVYKYRLPTRLDLLPFLLAWLCLPMIYRRWEWGVPAALFFAAGLAAISYNDLARKGKTVTEWLKTFPLLLTYYHVRLAGYVSEAVRLRLSRHGIARVDLRRFRVQQPSDNSR